MSAGSASLPPGKFKVLLRPGLLVVRPALIVEHVAAVDHQAGDLEHGEAATATSTTGMTRMSRKDFMRRGHRTFCARKTPAPPRRRPWPPTAWARGAAGSAPIAGRAAIAILDSRRNTLSPSASCFFSCIGHLRRRGQLVAEILVDVANGVLEAADGALGDFGRRDQFADRRLQRMFVRLQPLQPRR